MDLVQGEVKGLLQSALDVALSVVRANPTVLEALGAQLEGIRCHLHFIRNLATRNLIAIYVIYAWSVKAKLHLSFSCIVSKNKFVLL